MSSKTIPNTEKVTSSGFSETFTWGSCLMQNYRRTMQDFCISRPCIKPKTSLFAILDGFDSDEYVAFVGRNFEKTLINIEEFKNNDYKAAFLKSLEKIDLALKYPEEFLEGYYQTRIETIEKKIEQTEDRLDKRSYMMEREDFKKDFAKRKLNLFKTFCSWGGTTFLGILIDETLNKITVANVGDSKGFVCYSDKTLKILCEIHNGLSEKESQRIKEAGGRVFLDIKSRVYLKTSGDLGMSRCIGMDHCKQKDTVIIGTPDLNEYENHGNMDFILIASDGVFELKSDEEIKEFILKRLAEKMNEGKILEELFEFVRFKEEIKGIHWTLGKDNMGAVLINFKYKTNVKIEEEKE